MQDELDFSGNNAHTLEDDRKIHGDDGIGHEANDTESQWEAWKELPGSRHILRQAYRFAHHYSKDWIRHGQQVSAKLLWELTRHYIKKVKKRAERKGIDIRHWQGFALNNAFTPSLARHMVAHHPEWEGMFLMKKTTKEKAQDSLEKLEE